MTMTSPVSLTNQFLIAMPALADPNFSRTVTLVCAHSEEGAMGIVVNRPLNLTLAEVFSQMEIAPADETAGLLPVYVGGPVQTERGFVLHRSSSREWDNMLEISAEVSVTTSKDILEAMARGEGPREALVALGYAGWGPNQLEEEMAANAWLSCPADARILFETPSEYRWSTAASLLGVDMRRLSDDVGHA